MTAAENVTNIEPYEPIATLYEGDRTDVIEQLEQSEKALSLILPERVQQAGADCQHIADALLGIRDALGSLNRSIDQHQRRQAS